MFFPETDFSFCFEIVVICVYPIHQLHCTINTLYIVQPLSVLPLLRNVLACGLDLVTFIAHLLSLIFYPFKVVNFLYGFNSYFIGCTLVMVKASAPYVNADKTHWLKTFLSNQVTISVQ